MKTTKFLAVLAVLAMAFAVFAAIQPAEEQDAEDVGVTIDADTNLSTALTEATTYGISGSYTININVDLGYAATFYILDGKTATFNINATQSAAIIVSTTTAVPSITGATKVITITGAVTGTSFELSKETYTKVAKLKGEAASIDGEDANQLIGIGGDLKITGTDFATVTPTYGIRYALTTGATSWLYYAPGAVVSKNAYSTTDSTITPKAYTATVFNGTMTLKAYNTTDEIYNTAKLTYTGATGSYTMETTADANATVTVSGTDGTAANAKVWCTSGSIALSAEVALTTASLNGVTTAAVTDDGSKLSAEVTLLSNAYTDSEAGALFLYGQVDATVTDADGTANAVTLVTATGTLSYTVGSTTYKTSFTGASAVLTGKTITTLPTAGTLTLVSGTFENENATLANTLIVGESATLNLNGNLTLNSGVLKVIGTIVGITSERTIAGTSSANDKLYVAPEAVLTNIKITQTNLLCSDFVTATYVIGGTMTESKEYDYVTLSEDLVIPYGMSLTISKMLAMNEHSITVYGTLKILAGGAIGSSNTDASAIQLASTGVIDNKGAIGKNFPITVSHASNDDSYVTLIGVNGVAFGTTSTGSYLTIAGTTTKIASSIPTIDEHWVYAENVRTGGDLSITNGIELDCEPLYVTSGKTLTIGAGAILGEESTNKVIVQNKGTVVMSGTFFGTIAAQTYSDCAVNATPSYVELAFNSADAGETAPSTTYTSGSVTGFTITVDRVSYLYDNDGTIESHTSQRAYISGTLAVSNTDNVSKTLGIVGASNKAMPAYVAEDATLVSTTYANAKIGTNGGLIVLGTVYGPTEMAGAVGAHYSITSAVLGQMYYVSNFEDAIDAFEYADSKLITLVGYTGNLIKNDDHLYTIEENLDIEAGYSISGSSPMLIIGEDAIVTVKSDALLNAPVIERIDGMLIVMNGGACSPTVSQYQVVSHDSDNNYTYASLALVLANAEDGDVIDMVGASENTSIVIDKAVTLNVKAALQTYYLTIGEGAKVTLTSAGSLIMDCANKIESKLIVAGDLDVTAGTFTMADYAGTKTYTGSVVSAGMTVMTTGQFDTAADEGAEAYGAIYTNDDGNIVITSLATAAANAKSIQILNDYVSEEVIVLKKDGTLTIDEGADVIIGGIDLSNGVVSYPATIIVTEGTLTATIYGKSGIEGVAPVEIDVVDFIGGFTQTSVYDAAGVTTYVFSAADSTGGSVAIESGIVTVPAETTFVPEEAVGDIFTVGEDAILYLDADPVFKNYGSIVIDGTVTCDPDALVDLTVECDTYINGIVFCGKFTATDGVEYLVVTGTLSVQKESTVGTAGSNFILTGVLDNEDVTFNLANGLMLVGSLETAADPEITGKITLAAGSFIVSYDEMDYEDLAAYTYKETPLYLDDEEYLNVYTTSNSTVTLGKVISNKNVTFVAPGYDLSNVRKYAYWADDEGTFFTADPSLINEDAFYFPLIVQTLELKTSWANGLSLYIDNVKMTGNTYVIEVGAHKVTAQINAGYACDNMSITFNGVPVTAAGLLLTVEDDGAILAVSGDVYIPEPEPVTPEEKSEWTITTILLVILVILIAVMAVIVALRLNRS